MSPETLAELERMAANPPIMHRFRRDEIEMGVCAVCGDRSERHASLTALLWARIAARRVRRLGTEEAAS